MANPCHVIGSKHTVYFARDEINGADVVGSINNVIFLTNRFSNITFPELQNWSFTIKGNLVSYAGHSFLRGEQYPSIWYTDNFFSILYSLWSFLKETTPRVAYTDFKLLAQFKDYLQQKSEGMIKCQLIGDLRSCP